jgi:hypothetical protein
MAVKPLFRLNRLVMADVSFICRLSRLGRLKDFNLFWPNCNSFHHGYIAWLEAPLMQLFFLNYIMGHQLATPVKRTKSMPFPFPGPTSPTGSTDPTGPTDMPSIRTAVGTEPEI